MVYFGISFIASLVFVNFVVAIWPKPAIYQHGNEVIWIDKNTKWDFSPPRGLDSHIEARVRQAIKRANEAVLTKQLVPWKLRPHGKDFDPVPGDRLKATIKRVIIRQLSANETRAPDYDELDESYELYLSGQRGIEFTDSLHLKALVHEYGGPATVYIISPTSAGIIHALNSLVQLFFAHSQPEIDGVYSPFAPVIIKDKPKFPYRGVNLDTSRQWYPKEAIFRLIDGMTWTKFNRLHWHITDSQSWPLEVPSLPDLAKEGAYWKGLIYTIDDVQDIYKYAEDRGIQVIMEIDMPGHTSSIGYSYPDLIVGQNVQPLWTDVAAQPPSGHLKLSNTAVEDFLTKLFDDVVPRLTSYSKYFHTGGDEVNKKIYLLQEDIASADLYTIKPHLERFLEHAHGAVRKHGAIPVVWEEMITEWGVNLSKDVIVQVWLGDESVKNVTSQGYRTITGSYQFWYLDCGNGQWLDFHHNMFYPYNDWCSPKKSWRLMYTYDPVAGLTAEEAKFVLGGEVHIWSEQIDAQNLDSTVWPRACAAAEVLWSGRQDEHGNNRTFFDATPRLAELRERMVNWGIAAAPLTQLWCLQNDGDCVYPEPIVGR